MPEDKLANNGIMDVMFYDRHLLPPVQKGQKLNIQVSYSKVNGSFLIHHPHIVTKERCSPRYALK